MLSPFQSPKTAARVVGLVLAVGFGFAASASSADLYWFEYGYLPDVTGYLPDVTGYLPDVTDDCYRLRRMDLDRPVAPPEEVVSFCARGDIPGGPHPNYDSLAVGTAGIYWKSIEEQVFVAPKTGGTFWQTNLTPSIYQPDATRLAVKLSGGEMDQAGSFVYRPGGEEQFGIIRSDPFGQDATLLVPTSHFRPNLAVELDETHGKIYWSGACNGCSLTIGRSNLDGTASEVIGTNLYYDDFPAYLAVDSLGGKLYFADNGQAALMRSNLDGTNVEQVLTVGAVFSLAIDPHPIPEPSSLWLVCFVAILVACFALAGQHNVREAISARGDSGSPAPPPRNGRRARLVQTDCARNRGTLPGLRPFAWQIGSAEREIILRRVKNDGVHEFGPHHSPFRRHEMGNTTV